MSIICPDGEVLHFGDIDTADVQDGDGTSSTTGRRVSIRVFDWWFFVRVAMEYDLGLARYHSRKPVEKRTCQVIQLRIKQSRP